MRKEDYMRIALNLAKTAAAADETPVGAIVVDPLTGKIISCAANQDSHKGDFTAHAEMAAMRLACAKLGQKRLWNLDLYITLEPCTMCAAAISFARIHKVFFGAEDMKGGAVTNGVKFYEAATCHWRPEYEGGICQDECSQLLKDFFKAKRKRSR